MKQKSFSKKLNGPYLNNDDRCKIDCRLNYHLVLGNETDEGISDYWSLDLSEMIERPIKHQDYFPVAEEAFTYIKESIERLSLNRIELGMFVVLTPSLTPMNIPDSLLLQDIDKSYSPIFDFSIGPIIDKLKESYFHICLNHPFSMPLKSYYWESQSKDYFNPNTGRYSELISYNRFILFI